MKTNKIRNTMLHKVQHVTVACSTIIFECPILFSDCIDISWTQTLFFSSKCPNDLLLYKEVLWLTKNNLFSSKRKTVRFVIYPFSIPTTFITLSELIYKKTTWTIILIYKKKLCNSPHRPVAHKHLWKHFREGNSILEMQEDPQAWKLGCRKEALSHSLL